MQFSRSIETIIRQRTSQRRYRKQPIENDKRQLLEELMQESTLGPLGSSCRFEMIATDLNSEHVLEGLGTYGFVTGTTGFIVGAVKDSPKALEDYGYLMERIILKSTDLNLGTCWLGGSFTRSEFANRINLDDKEILPAVAAIGYATERRRLADRMMRLMVQSNHRKHFESLFFLDDFSTPLSVQQAEMSAIPLQMVRLAPSSGNSQPWRIIKHRYSGRYHFFINRSVSNKKTQRILRFADLPRIDIGIAMCHFELSFKENSVIGEWLVEDPKIDPPSSHVEYIVSWESVS